MKRPDDDTVAADLALGAGRVLLELRSSVDGATADSRSMKDEGDRRSQAYLAEQLGNLKPDDAVLSEEAVDNAARLDAEYVWIIDPLDGTREFSEWEAGVWRTDWAVHVALWHRDAGLISGAVTLPARDQIFRTDQPATVPAATDGPLRLAVSRTRPPAIVDEIAKAGDVEFVPMGSAGVKATAVLTGEVDAYIHGGGQYEWDSAAPVAVAQAAGLHTSRLDGSPLHYNEQNPYLPDLVVCRPEHWDDINRRITAAQRVIDAKP